VNISNSTMKLSIIVVLIVVVLCVDSITCYIRTTTFRKTSTIVRNLFIVPDRTTNSNDDTINNNIKQYLITDDNKTNNKNDDNSHLTHHVIDVPSLNEIKATIASSKRTKKSKEFCVRTGGYPDNNIKANIYNYILASSLYQHDLVKIKTAEKEKLKIQKCVELKIEREAMMTFGIL